jgi:ADP-ribosylglycohydrolase
MRLSAIVTAFHNNAEAGMNISREQSYITHNSVEAAE